MRNKTSRRIGALDVVRGFALCGILVANVKPISNLSGVILEPDTQNQDLTGLLVYDRFFPIFALMFGIGFALMVRSGRDRPALLRRLLVLLAIGLAHMFLLWPGDVLTYYAVFGLIALLPSSWLPRWAVAVLAGVTGVVTLLFSGGYVLALPLMLAGAALVRYGVIDRIESSARGLWAVGLGFAALAVPAVWAQVSLSSSVVFPLAGILTAGVYVCALLLLLKTPLGPLLRGFFAPLGRMALTNYLTATVLVLAAAHAHGRPETWSWNAVLVLTAAVLAVQWAFSTLWLRRFRFGPLEWLWRWATWLSRPSLRVDSRPGPGRTRV